MGARVLSVKTGSTAPAPPEGSAGRGEHVVQFYESDEALLEGLNKFIGSALQAGNSAVVVATQSHREALAKALNSQGI